jgi:hypothetical protein
MMITITETTLATGPWIDASICVSGYSQGMLEPAAYAGDETSATKANA